MKKFDYYLKLRDLGIKEKHAVKMTKQVGKAAREKAADLENAADAVMQFTDWDSTAEGYTYWCDLHEQLKG